MRITVELDETQIREVSRLTGIAQKSPAIALAVREFIRQKERELFLKRVLAGETDYLLSNDQVEAGTAWEGSSTSSDKS